MTTRSLLDEFLDEIDETIQAEGMILVGHFVWILRGLDRELTSAQMEQLSRDAYAIVRRRHDLRLLWSGWPVDTSTAAAADETAALEFDLDPDEPVESPLQVLVLAEDVAAHLR